MKHGPFRTALGMDHLTHGETPHTVDSGLEAPGLCPDSANFSPLSFYFSPTHQWRGLGYIGFSRVFSDIFMVCKINFKRIL